MLRAQSVREEIAANPDKAGGVYYVPPHLPDFRQTPPPKGYRPAYISYYGRHGARFLYSDAEYENVMQVFTNALNQNALTPLGKDVYTRVKKVYDYSINRAGDLTPSGVQQQKNLASRMYEAYPGIFSKNARVNATSSYVLRCVLSMAAFSERLKEINPRLQITRDAGKRTTRYNNFFRKDANPDLSDSYLGFIEKGSWRKGFDSIQQKYIQPERIMKLLFRDTNFQDSIDSRKFMKELFGFAINMQDINIGISFFDLFNADELYGLSLCNNYEYYVTRGPSALNKRYPEYYAKLLLEDILNKADAAIRANSPAAELRFGHDSNLMPLLALMQIEGCNPKETEPEKIAERWSVFKLTPIAAYLQLVFYKKKDYSDILVKVIFNDHEVHIPLKTDIFPYYRWKDVRQFYEETLRELKEPSLD